jgi:hypothetical protein
MGDYTRDVSRQRFGEHVPAARNRRTTIEILLETVFSTWSVARSYLEDSRDEDFSPETEEYPLLKPLPGNI